LAWHGLLLPLTRFRLLDGRSGAVIASDAGCGGRFRKKQRRERLLLVQFNLAFPDQIPVPRQKLDAKTVAFCEGSAMKLMRYSSRRLQSCAIPTRRSSDALASLNDHTVRLSDAPLPARVAGVCAA